VKLYEDVPSMITGGGASGSRGPSGTEAAGSLLLSRRTMLAAGLAALATTDADPVADAAPARRRDLHPNRDRDRPADPARQFRDGELWPGRAFPTGFIPPRTSDWMGAGDVEIAAAVAGPAPVIAGFEWYSSFDFPVIRQGVPWIGLGTNWGSIRALHAVVLRPPSIPDLPGAWQLYNQGATNACIGFAVSRAATLFNRQLYAGDPLYRAALLVDDTPGIRDTGTSVDAGLRVLRDTGAWLIRGGKTIGPLRAHGIRSFRPLLTVADIQAALGSRESFVRILSSWGVGYPREVRMPVTSLALLLNRNSQICLPVDRITGGA